MAECECEDVSGEAFYQRYINEAPFIPGDQGISPENLDPPNSDLYDAELIEKGKQFVRRNFFAVALGLMISGIAGCLVGRVRVVLLRQSGVHIKETAFKRYLANFARIQTWYQSDFTTQDTRATTDLNAVRASHNLAPRRHSSLRLPQLPPLAPDDLSFLKGIQQIASGFDETDFPQDLMREDPQVPISQFDMVNAQIAFIGPFILHPKSYGVHDTQGLEGFIRLWSLMGRQLGIQDRFNIALHYEKTGGTTDAFGLIEQRLVAVGLKHTDDTALIMWKAMLGGLCDQIPLVRWKALVLFMLKTWNLPVHLLDEHMDWRDRVSSRILHFVVGQLTKWTTSRLVINSISRFYVWIATRIYC